MSQTQAKGTHNDELALLAAIVVNTKGCLSYVERCAIIAALNNTDDDSRLPSEAHEKPTNLPLCYAASSITPCSIHTCFGEFTHQVSLSRPMYFFLFLLQTHQFIAHTKPKQQRGRHAPDASSPAPATRESEKASWVSVFHTLEDIGATDGISPFAVLNTVYFKPVANSNVFQGMKHWLTLHSGVCELLAHWRRSVRWVVSPLLAVVGGALCAL